MNQIRIVADSSADTLSLEAVSFVSVPLTIRVGEQEYVDDASLDVEQMTARLLHSRERSSTACPSVGEWLAAFGDAEYVICITITSTLSGCHNVANSARQTYEEAHPGRRVYVVDSLSTGPEIRLLLEKVSEGCRRGLEFEALCKELDTYRRHTALLFLLESMHNLANNGRVSRLAASAAGILGIRVLGRASDKGDLEQLARCRGEKKALSAILSQMQQQGYCGGRVRIGHCQNEAGAQALTALLSTAYPQADILAYPSRGLCSFYAERGGLLVGFETA